MHSMDTPIHTQKNNLAEVILFFLRLGFTAFGGPAAYIAMMRREVVERRNWISDERFLDLLSIVNLIPGPNATELAIYLGYIRAGWLGLIVGGVCFIGPAMLIVLTLAWAYATYGTLPEVSWLLYGIKPVVIALIAQAVLGLSRTMMKGVEQIVLAVLVLVLYLFGINVLILLFGGALLFGIIRGVERWLKPKSEVVGALLPFSFGNLRVMWQKFAALSLSIGAISPAVPFSMLTLFLTFLKIGAVLYGSGYVLLAFLRTDFVLHLHWLTDRQLLDAVSIGQFTPGPLFSTATFIGYLVGGWVGALLATVAIFLPSFVFVALIRPLATALRRSPWTSVLLDGVNVAAVALMAGVFIQLGQNALIDVLTWAIALVALAVLLRFKIDSVWLILAGAASSQPAHGRT